MLDVAIKRRQGSFDLDIAFQAPSQGVTALFGPSGSGKSSVINAIAGLSRPDTWHILLDGTVLPVGVITGALGAPFLLWLLVTANRKDA